MPPSHENPDARGSAAQIDRQPASALCVYCRRRPVDPRWRPFCGERCRLQDLARWIDGDYRVAGEAVSPEGALPGHGDEHDTDGRRRS
jgi:uncharacterized protein